MKKLAKLPGERKAPHQNSDQSIGVAVDRILDDPQLAGLLQIKLPTLFSHVSRGNDLPPFFLVGSQRRWRESQVWEWIEQREKGRRKRNFNE